MPGTAGTAGPAAGAVRVARSPGTAAVVAWAVTAREQETAAEAEMAPLPVDYLLLMPLAGTGELAARAEGVDAAAPAGMVARPGARAPTAPAETVGPVARPESAVMVAQPGTVMVAKMVAAGATPEAAAPAAMAAREVSAAPTVTAGTPGTAVTAVMAAPAA